MSGWDGTETTCQARGRETVEKEQAAGRGPHTGRLQDTLRRDGTIETVGTETKTKATAIGGPLIGLFFAMVRGHSRRCPPLFVSTFQWL